MTRARALSPAPADAAWPQQATDVAGELRRQLDEQYAKSAELDRAVMLRDQRIAELEAERQVLRGTLLGEAELADPYGEPSHRGAEWWHTCWKEVSRHRSELMVRVQNMERWLLDARAVIDDAHTERERSLLQNRGLARQLAETEGDFAALFEECDELRRQLALSEKTREELTAELEELRHQLAFGDAVREQISGEPAQGSHPGDDALAADLDAALDEAERELA